MAIPWEKVIDFVQGVLLEKALTDAQVLDVAEMFLVIATFVAFALTVRHVFGKGMSER
jgi:hypothetical protein